MNKTVTTIANKACAKMFQFFSEHFFVIPLLRKAQKYRKFDTKTYI